MAIWSTGESGDSSEAGSAFVSGQRTTAEIIYDDRDKIDAKTVADIAAYGSEIVQQSGIMNETGAVDVPAVVSPIPNTDRTNLPA